MKYWLATWFPVLCIFAILPWQTDSGPWLMLAGILFWGVGTTLAHYGLGRGAVAGLSMVGGLTVAVFVAVCLTLVGLHDREVFTVFALGLMGGLQLALGELPLAALLLNLLVYGGLVSVAVATSGQNWWHAGVLWILGPPALLLPSALLGWLRRRRGEQLPQDFGRLESLLRLGLGVSVALLAVATAVAENSLQYWVGLVVIAAMVGGNLRKS